MASTLPAPPPLSVVLCQRPSVDDPLPPALTPFPPFLSFSFPPRPRFSAFPPSSPLPPLFGSFPQSPVAPLFVGPPRISRSPFSCPFLSCPSAPLFYPFGQYVPS